MIFSVKIIAALVTVIVRGALGRINYSQAVLLEGPLAGSENYTYLVFVASGLFSFLSRNIFLHYLIDTVRKASRRKPTIPPSDSMDTARVFSGDRVAQRVVKAKTCVNSNNFQDSRTLQQRALRYIAQEPSEFFQTVNTKWTTSKFVPKCSIKTEHEPSVQRSQRHRRSEPEIRWILAPRHFEEDVSQSPNHFGDELQMSRWVGGSSNRISVPLNAEPESIDSEMSDVALPGPSWANPDVVRGKTDLCSKLPRKVHHKKTDHLARRICKLQISPKKMQKVWNVVASSSHTTDIKHRDKGDYVIKKT